MSRTCKITGKKPMAGNNVSKARTRRGACSGPTCSASGSTCPKRAARYGCASPPGPCAPWTRRACCSTCTTRDCASATSPYERRRGSRRRPGRGSHRHHQRLRPRRRRSIRGRAGQGGGGRAGGGGRWRLVVRIFKDESPAALKALAERLRSAAPRIVAFLVTTRGGGLGIACAVSDDLAAGSSSISAVELVREAAAKAGGGGRPTFATAGAKRASNLDAVLGSVRARLERSAAG